MRAWAAAACGVSAALLLAQAGQGAPRRKPRARADGGPVLLGTDPQGRLRPQPPYDGGVAVVDAGVNATQRQIAELRARVDALEQQLGQSQQQSQQLQQIAAEMQQLRAQVADAEARRQAEAEQQAMQRDQLRSAIEALSQAQYALAGGSYDVTGALDQAQAAFSGQAQRDVQAARAALQNHDLSQARAYLSAAISDAQLGR